MCYGFCIAKFFYDPSSKGDNKLILLFRFGSRGCTERMPRSGLEAHEQVCLHRPPMYPCPILSLCCSDRMLATQLPEHVLGHHSKWLARLSFTQGVFGDTYRLRVPRTFIRQIAGVTSFWGGTIIIIGDQHHFYLSLVEVEGLFMAFVHHLGDVEVGIYFMVTIQVSGSKKKYHGPVNCVDTLIGNLEDESDIVDRLKALNYLSGQVFTLCPSRVYFRSETTLYINIQRSSVGSC